MKKQKQKQKKQMDAHARLKLRIFLKNLLLNTVGSIIYAVGVGLFLDPNRLASGGVTGIAIILTEIFGLETGTWVIILNIPLMIIGVWKFGFKVLFSTIWSLCITSFSINILVECMPLGLTSEPILAALAGATLVSVGIGLVFRAGGTTGGSDIAVKLLRLKFPHISTGGIFLLTDGIIVAAAGFAFKNADLALYAGIAVLVQALVLNMVLYGSDEARMVYIISKHNRKISERFMSELDAGVTYLNGEGAYTGDEKQVLMCVMKMKTLPVAREIVRDEDNEAFMIVTKATSVFGEGFKSHDSAEL